MTQRSDLKGRWMASWQGWARDEALRQRLSRDLLGSAEPTDATTEAVPRRARRRTLPSRLSRRGKLALVLGVCTVVMCVSGLATMAVNHPTAPVNTGSVIVPTDPSLPGEPATNAAAGPTTPQPHPAEVSSSAEAPSPSSSASATTSQSSSPTSAAAPPATSRTTTSKAPKASTAASSALTTPRVAAASTPTVAPFTAVLTLAAGAPATQFAFYDPQAQIVKQGTLNPGQSQRYSDTLMKISFSQGVGVRLTVGGTVAEIAEENARQQYTYMSINGKPDLISSVISV